MHTRGRKSSQSKEADPKTPSCEARRFFQDEDKEEVTSIASQGNLGAVQIVPPTCSHKEGLKRLRPRKPKKVLQNRCMMSKRRQEPIIEKEGCRMQQ
jgi:hypothetical protein